MNKSNNKSCFRGVSPYLFEIIYLLGQDRARLPIMISMFILISILDLLGLSLLVPLVSYLTNPEDMGYVSQKIILVFGHSMDENEIIELFSATILVVFLIKSMAILYINKTIIDFSNDQMLRIRLLLMSSYQSLSYIDYLGRNSAEYVYSIQTLSSQYANSVVLPLLRIVSESIVMVVVIGFLAWVSPSALAVMVTIFVSFALGYDLFFRSKLKSYGKNINNANTKTVKAVNEGMRGFREIQIFGKSKHFYNVVSSESKKVAINNSKSQLITVAPRYLIELILIIFSISMVVWTLRIEGGLHDLMPVFAAFGVASIRILPIVNNIINGTAVLRIGRDSVSKLYRDIKQLNFNKDTREDISDTFSMESFESLKLDNVIFRYSDRGNNILNQVSMEVMPGESIGIIGPSGSGKSTLLDVLLGNLRVIEGSVCFNNKSITNKIEEWRRHIAYLPQQVFLTDDTLRKNIALGEDEVEIDNDRVEVAILKARLSSLVKEMPQGVDTILGENGVRLSGGQRQRIALARAFYYDRDVLVLDESTSALDNKTEQEIVNEIRYLRGDITTIIVAHRLTTVRYCDRVYELKNGKIREIITPSNIVRS